MNKVELEREYQLYYHEWCRWCASWAIARLHAKNDKEWMQNFNGWGRVAHILSTLDSLAKEINALP